MVKELKTPTEEPEPEEAAPPETPSEPVAAKSTGKFARFRAYYAGHKKVSIPVTIFVFLLLWFAIPFTRYSVLGLFIKKTYSVTVLDNSTHKPVSSASVSLAGVNATTNSSGNATLKAKLGRSKLTVQKKYYENFSHSVTVGLSQSKNDYQVSLTATGRQVPITVTNKITGKPVENIAVKAEDTEAKTDKDGTVNIVVPAEKAKVSATLSGDGYNETSVTITVTDQSVKENSFAVVPSGKVYFLSKASGKIDVVKTNLDGTSRQTVLTGTGKEDENNTSLLASRDWKYLALLSRRDSDKAKLYLIDTSNDKLSTMDEGNATFALAGWNDNTFVYTVIREKDAWAGKAQALKSFNAANGQLKTLDETQAEGTGPNDYASENFGTVSIIEGSVVYPKAWQTSYYSPIRSIGKQATINSIKPDGTNKQVLKSITLTGASYSSINVAVSKPDEAYFTFYQSGTNASYYEYEDGKIKDSNAEAIKDSYPTFLISPDGNQTFWSEPRDGKNTLFVGDKHGESGKEVAKLSEYLQYGWYTDDYLLVSKNSSELYIMPKEGGQVLKVSDYHKPAYQFAGYGGGYGGF